MNDSQPEITRDRLQEISNHFGCICRKLSQGRFLSIFSFHLPGIFRAVAK